MRFFAALFFTLFIPLAIWSQDAVWMDIAPSQSFTLNKPALKYTQPTAKTGQGPDYFGEFVAMRTSQKAMQWEALRTGVQASKIEVLTQDASSLNFLLENVRLSPEAQIITYNPNHPDFKITYTHKHVSKDGLLTTFPISGREQHLVLLSPNPEKETFTIKQAVYGTKSTAGFGDAGACNINANCPQGDGYRNPQKATNIILVNGNGRCTGTLINNSTNDGTPYVISAAHCIPGNASAVRNWSYGFGFESPGCSDQEVEPEVFTGSEIKTFLGGVGVHDAALLLMDNKPSHPNGIYYAGWSTAPEVPSNVRVFHHPSGDSKKISVQNSAITEAPYLEDPDEFITWKVVWDEGTTEGGSSGSSLLNEAGLVIGNLTGGRAACNAPDSADYFGPLKTAFEYRPSDSSTSYAPWLDPSFSKTVTLGGLNPDDPKPNIDLAIAGIRHIPFTSCDSVLQPEITVYNAGTNAIATYTVVISDGNSGDVLAEESFDNLASNQSTAHDLGPFTIPFSTQSVTIAVTLAESDARPFNNTAQLDVTRITGAQLTMDITLDDFGSENRWEIVTENGTVVAAGGPYGNNQEGSNKLQSVCLENEQCYELKFYDSYGDGMCCDFGNGSYTLLNQNGDTLAQGWNTETPGTPQEVVETTPFCTSGGNSADSTPVVSASLFPNPVNDGVLNYHMGTTQATAWEYRMVTVSGKILQRGVLTTAQGSISVAQLPKGMYIIEITGASSTYQSRIVIQ